MYSKNQILNESHFNDIGVIRKVTHKTPVCILEEESEHLNQN